MKALIVGAGIAGLSAGVLLRRKGWDVQVLESRCHIGGNCADYLYNGIFVHQYGPHIFHTSESRVYRFFSEFTQFNGYQHQVMAETRLVDYPIPIPYSRATEQAMGGRILTDDEIREYIFRVYTERMWGVPYKHVPEAITSRVNLRRDNFDTLYFGDKYQGMPTAGYTAMFQRMVDEIGRDRVELGVRERAWKPWAEVSDLVIYTGPIDDYYDWSLGELPYRAIQFDLRRAQPNTGPAVLNYCVEVPASRITNFAKFYENTKNVDFTVTCTEYPKAFVPDNGLDPSYPMRGFPGVDDLIKGYQDLNPGTNVLFMGRLGSYKYMNMDATVSDVMLKLAQKLGEKVYA